MDPLAESTLDPYGYVWNNPVNLIDPTGMIGEDWVEKENRFFWDSRVKSQEDAERYWGKSAIHHRPNEYGYQSSQGYVLLSDDAKWVRNGQEYTAPDEGSFINVLMRNITGGQEFYNFYTSEGGRRYEGMGKDLLKTGDIVSWINFDEIVKPSLPTSNTLSSFAEAFKNIGDLWGMRKSNTIRKDTIVSALTPIRHKMSDRGVGYTEDSVIHMKVSINKNKIGYGNGYDMFNNDVKLKQDSIWKARNP